MPRAAWLCGVLRDTPAIPSRYAWQFCRGMPGAITEGKQTNRATQYTPCWPLGRATLGFPAIQACQLASFPPLRPLPASLFSSLFLPFSALAPPASRCCAGRLPARRPAPSPRRLAPVAPYNAAGCAWRRRRFFSIPPASLRRSPFPLGFALFRALSRFFALRFGHFSDNFGQFRTFPPMMAKPSHW